MKREIVVWLVGILVVVTTGVSTFAVGGDMGVGTDPCTNGTEEHPYLIEDITDFNSFSNDPNYWAEDVHIRLDIDIDLAGEVYTTAVIASTGSYEGIFDGNNHVVRNLNIDANGIENDYLGLFGYLDRAEVNNLGIHNIMISGGENSDYVGGLCGYNNYGDIINCYSTGTVAGYEYIGGLCGSKYAGNILNSYSTVSVTGEEYVGGLCGNNEEGMVSDCYSTGQVTGYNNVGGFCGYNDDGRIYNSYSTGVVEGVYVYVGGFCGRDRSQLVKIKNSFWDVETSGWGMSGYNNFGATGKTTAEMQDVNTFTDAGWDFSGNDLSWIMPVDKYPELYWEQNIAYTGDVDVDVVRGESVVHHIDVYNLAEETLGWNISGEEMCDWITGLDPNSGSSSGPSDRQTVNIYIDTTGMSAGDYSFSGLTLSADNGASIVYPIQLHVSHALLPGNGTYGDPYRIESLFDFNAFSDPVNAETYWAEDVHTRLDIDIDLAGKVYITSVIADGSYYYGIFDGNDNEVRNLTIDTGGEDKSGLGLFYRVGSSGQVGNLHVEDVNIFGGEELNSCGGLCSYNKGTLINCTVSGSVSGGYGGGGDYVGILCGYNNGGDIINCHTSGYTCGHWYIGGLCGESTSGTIRGCSSNSIVEGLKDPESRYDSGVIGGLCGEITGGEVSNCYTTGEVTGGYGASDYGGICGANVNGTIENCWSTCNITGGENSISLGGFCGNNWHDGVIRNCWSSGTVYAGDDSGDIAGFCGINGYRYGATINNCYSTGNVICGNSSGLSTDIYNPAGIGGFCGSNRSGSSIDNCYSTGLIGTGAGSGNIGGFCGYEDDSTTTNSYFYQFADVNNGLGVGLDELQMVDGNSFAGFDFAGDVNDGMEDIWDIVSGRCPKLNWEDGDGPMTIALYEVTSLSGSGDVNEPFEINSYEDFNEFRMNKLLCYGYYTLNIDIDLEDGEYNSAVINKTFGGNFEGNNNIIRNFNINADYEKKNHLGLFGSMLGSSSVIENLGVEDINIVSQNLEVSNLHSYNIGGLCGKNFEGTINNCYTNGSIRGARTSLYDVGGLCGRNECGRINNSYSNISINTGRCGSSSIGGLCGQNFDGTISGCHSSGLIAIGWDDCEYVGGLCGMHIGPGPVPYPDPCDIITDSYSNVSIISLESSDEGLIITGYLGDYIGGLCGSNYESTIINSYSTGSIEGADHVGGLCGTSFSSNSNISNCYSTGTVSGYNYIGGFCGNNDCPISNCYSTGAVSGGNYVGGFCSGNGGTIRNCYSTGSVIGNNRIGGFCSSNSDIISNCYSVGSVTGNSDVGGFCGSNYSAAMNNSFWDVNSSGVGMPGDDNCSAIGKTTGQMQTEVTFTSAGWDFVDEWWINEYRDYPKLGWQPFGDLNNDSHVDMLDVAVMGLGWFSCDGDVNFNSVCELSGDWVIDEADLLEVGGMWLAGPRW